MHQEKQEENELRALPPASAAHLRALDVSIRRTARQNGVSQEDFQVRKAVVARMEELIRRHLPACSLRLYGSTLTQFAFRSSDINVDVRHPPSVGLLCSDSSGGNSGFQLIPVLSSAQMSQPEVLIQVLEILKNSCKLSPAFSAATDFMVPGLVLVEQMQA